MILIIESNLGMRRVIRSIVGEDGSDVREYESAAEGLRLCESEPDWILFDLEIKDTDPVAALREIKRRWPAAIVVAISSYDESELREAARAAGAAAYLLKEDLSELKGLMRSKELYQ